MNKSEKFKEDILYQFINPEKIEKAPEGFTENVMTGIEIESLSSVVTKPDRSIINVPIISGLIIAALIISAVLLSTTDKKSMVFSFMDQLKNVHIALPDVNFDKLIGFALPEWMIYLLIGLFMLCLFDLALDTLFHRERK